MQETEKEAAEARWVGRTDMGSCALEESTGRGKEQRQGKSGARLQATSLSGARLPRVIGLAQG